MVKSLSFNRNLLSSSSLVTIGILFFAANVLAVALFSSWRLDLTSGGLYTLSQGTRNIIGNLPEPVTLRLYISKQLATSAPAVSAYVTRVEELLREYEREANDKLSLQILDPEPFSEEEDRAVAYGLQGVPVDDTGSRTLYFGLVGTNSVSDQQTIPFFDPSRNDQLEYDVTQLVYRLSHPKQPVVGVLSTLPILGGGPAAMSGGGADGTVIGDQIRRLFEVREIPTDTDAIPKDVDVLMVVHPKDFKDTTLYAIDQFILRGGRAMLFVDPYAESDTASNAMMGGHQAGASNLDKLFSSWGIKMAEKSVAGDLGTAKKVQFNRGARPVVIDYPIWFEIRPEQMASDDVITGNLSQITMASPGILSKQDKAEIEFVSLLKTSSQGSTIPVDRLGPFMQPQDLLRGYQSDGEHTLAARVRGKVKTAFPDGKPKPSEDAAANPENLPQEDQPHIAEAAEPINVIVVADTDFLQDRYWAQVRNFFGQRVAIPEGGNGNFVVSALDNLTGSNDLISIRNRAGHSRPFTRVKSLQQEAAQNFLQKEKQLQDELRETEKKLGELQQSKDQQGSNSLVLSSEQQAELTRFRQEKIRIRKELRDVQHELNKSIERLENTMMFLNIGLMPLLVGVGGLWLSLRRKKRMDTKIASTTTHNTVATEAAA